ncbi:MAG: amphi-Trp domain-containing protein [Thermodesulfobacteriota bacterium]
MGDKDKDKQGVKLKDTLSAAQAGERLAWLRSGLLEGTLAVPSGQDRLCLSPASVIDMKIKASRKKDREKIAVEMEWRTGSPFDPRA